MTLLLAGAEAALLYSVYDPQHLDTTLAFAAWTLILIYVVVMLVRYAEAARGHREQLAARLQAEMRDSVDEIVNSLADPQQRDTAVRDAVQLVRARYDATGPPRQDRST